MKCEKCGTQLPENSRFCDNCGAAQEIKKAQPVKKKRKTGKILLICAVVIVPMLLFFYCTDLMFVRTSVETEARIAYCHYDNYGNLIKEEWDNAAHSEDYDVVLDIYVFDYLEKDGVVDGSVSISYDLHGNMNGGRVEGMYSSNRMGNGIDYKYSYDYGLAGGVTGAVLYVDETQYLEAAMERDWRGNITKVKYYDENGLQTSVGETYTYDLFGRLTGCKRQDKLGERELTYQYTLFGKLKTVSDGSTTYHYDYDLFGKLKSIQSVREDGVKSEVYSFRYRLDGKLKSYTIGDDTIAYRYDIFGNVIEEIRNGETWACYTYKPIFMTRWQAEKLHRYNNYWDYRERWNQEASRSFYAYMIPTPQVEPYVPLYS